MMIPKKKEKKKTSLIQARSSMVKPQALLNVLLVSQPDMTIPKVFKETETIKGF
jgi:hypothetical protein